MSKLQCLKNTELSEYCVNILSKHDIRLVVEFIKEKSEKLMKILNLSAAQVQKIKTELRRIYGPVHRNLESQLRRNDEDEANECFSTFTFLDETKSVVEIKWAGQCYSTLIGPLDDLLAPSVLTRSKSMKNEKIYTLGPSHLTSKIMWEICGPSGVGKTQLALTLLCNFVQLHQSEALYIDTKLDFSAIRIKQILTSRQLSPEAVAGTLQAIKVERVLSAQGVVEMLDSLHMELRKGNNHVKDIKLIVIDSLPAVWFLLKADLNRLAGKWLLSRLAQIIYRLCDEFAIAVICVNLSLIPSLSEQQLHNKASLVSKEDQDISDILEDDDLDAAAETKNLAYRQVMGRFWLSKPRLRLSMEHISEEDREMRRSSRRLLKVMQSTCRVKKGESCIVRICDQGVV